MAERAPKDEQAEADFRHAVRADREFPVSKTGEASLTLVFGSDYNSRSYAAVEKEPGGLSRAA